jgi:hypothetical protein
MAGSQFSGHTSFSSPPPRDQEVLSSLRFRRLGWHRVTRNCRIVNAEWGFGPMQMVLSQAEMKMDSKLEGLLLLRTPSSGFVF